MNIEHYATIAGKAEAGRLNDNIERELENVRNDEDVDGMVWTGTEMVCAIQNLEYHHYAYGVAMMGIIERELEKAESNLDYPDDLMGVYCMQKRTEIYKYAMQHYHIRHNVDHHDGCAYCRHVFNTTK